MFTSKFYQVFLFITFALTITLLFSAQSDKLDQLGQAKLSNYQQYSQSIDKWPESGRSIYQKVSQNSSIRFFQFIDLSDNRNSFTTGNLLPDTKTLGILFRQNIGTYTNLSNGRIHIKFNLGERRRKIINEFLQISLILTAIYLLLALTAYICFRRYQYFTEYLADFIEGIPNFKSGVYHSIQLPNQFKKIELAIEVCSMRFTTKLDQIIQENERLNKDAIIDNLTGLHSRQMFLKKLAEIEKQKTSQIGSIIILRASELGHINQLQGRNAGDSYLSKVANLLTALTKKNLDAKLYRVSSAEFAAVLPGLSFSNGKCILPKLKSLLDEYQQLIKTSSVAHFALIPYSTGAEPVSLVSMADTAISIAQTLGPNCFHAMEKATSSDQIGDSHWRNTIEKIINQQSMTFYHQPIQSCNKHKKFYQEFLTRFKNDEGKALPTSSVIAMAERHDLIVEVDKLIIIKAIRILKSNPQLNSSIGINISVASALNTSFQAWFKNFLSRHSNLSNKLVLEVNEVGMQSNIMAAASFVKQVHSVGARVAFEHFGTGFTAFKFFKDVRPDFIKLDSSFTKGIETNEDNRFIVRMMVDIARRINVPIIATSIESQSEKIEFEQLQVDGLQGFFIATPKVLQAA